MVMVTNIKPAVNINTTNIYYFIIWLKSYNDIK